MKRVTIRSTRRRAIPLRLFSLAWDIIRQNVFYPVCNRTCGWNVQMNYTSIDLGEVVAVGTRYQTSTLQTMNADRVKLLPDPAGGSIESLVVTFAGVSSSNELSSQYSVRGGSYDENIVYVNGLEVFRPLLIRSGQQEGLSFINPDLTEAVNFAAGGFEARYGDKMSSVLDITYKKPKLFEGRPPPVYWEQTPMWEVPSASSHK